MINENMNVEIHSGVLIGTTICVKFITGKVVKVNAKSIKVHMTHKRCTKNGKTSYECDMNEVVTFAFWKTTNKNVNLYKNNYYGVIEITE